MLVSHQDVVALSRCEGCRDLIFCPASCHGTCQGLIGLAVLPEPTLSRSLSLALRPSLIPSNCNVDPAPFAPSFQSSMFPATLGETSSSGSSSSVLPELPLSGSPTTDPCHVDEPYPSRTYSKRAHAPLFSLPLTTKLKVEAATAGFHMHSPLGHKSSRLQPGTSLRRQYRAIREIGTGQYATVCESTPSASCCGHAELNKEVIGCVPLPGLAHDLLSSQLCCLKFVGWHAGLEECRVHQTVTKAAQRTNHVGAFAACPHSGLCNTHESSHFWLLNPKPGAAHVYAFETSVDVRQPTAEGLADGSSAYTCWTPLSFAASSFIPANPVAPFFAVALSSLCPTTSALHYDSWCRMKRGRQGCLCLWSGLWRGSWHLL